MKKSKLLLALAISAMVINTAYASEEMKPNKKEQKMEEVANEKISDTYVVKKINEEGVEVYKKSNPEDLYNIPKKDFKDIDLIEGLEVEIESDDVILETYPAQFAKIYKISEVKADEELSLIHI